MSAPQGYAPIPASGPASPSTSSRSPSRRTLTALALAAFAASLFAYVTFVRDKPFYYHNHQAPITHQSPIKASHHRCKCPRIYQPVCCATHHGPRTAPNKCVCECHGRPLHPGPCGPTPPTTPPPAPSSVPPPHCICPLIYAPVCCKTPSGKVMTKGNECQCKCDGGSVLADHPCPHDSGGSHPQTSGGSHCICTREYNPTCCASHHGIMTASNPCVCKCHGIIIHPGPCYGKS